MAQLAQIAASIPKKPKAPRARKKRPVKELTETAKAMHKDLIAGKLGFKDILLVKRHPLNISHVYVYHVEGYIPGGGVDEECQQFFMCYVFLLRD